MNNNDILKKLRVALKLRDEDIINILKLVDFDCTKSELGALFRNEDHPKYVECGDQLLRNFLNGLIIHLRGPMPNSRKIDGEEKVKSAKFQSSKPKERTFAKDKAPIKKTFVKKDDKVWAGTSKSGKKKFKTIEQNKIKPKKAE